MQLFSIIKPSPLLAPFIRYYWILQENSISPVSERTLPIGCMQMVFHKGNQLLSAKEKEIQPRSFVSGQSMTYSDVFSTGPIEMIVIVFQPYASKAFIKMPAHLFQEQNIAIEELDDKELQNLSKRITETFDHVSCIRLIESFLMQRLYTFSQYNIKRLSAALEVINIHPEASLSQLADTACLSTKQFSRIFNEYVGTTPQKFIRIIRLHRALYRMQQYAAISFSQLAYECGFADQSHMIKEFRLFSGYTPKEYLSICSPYSDYFTEK